MVGASSNVKLRNRVEFYTDRSCVGEVSIVKIDSENVSTSKGAVGLDKQRGSFQIVIDKLVTFCGNPTWPAFSSTLIVNR